MNQVVAQVNQCGPPGRPWQLAGPDAPARLAQGLHAALGPAKLLSFVGRKLNRNLGRGDHVVVIEGAPAGQLGAIAQIQIFAERILLPATGGWIFDAGPSPDPGGAVEAQEKAGSLAAVLLDGKVAIQGQGLALRKQGEVAIQMPPPRLDKADPLRAGGQKVGHELLEEIGCGLEIRVEDRDELTLGQGQGVSQRASFVAGSVLPANDLQVPALASPVGAAPVHQQARFVV